MSVVECRDQGAIRVVTLNRPDQLNALNTETLVGMRAALADAARDGAVRCLVLTGAGRGFCAGADVDEWASEKETPPEHDWVAEATAMVQELYGLSVPTLAMIDGAAVGAGLDLALACDFRLATARSKFICAYTNIGYPPDCGGSWLMPRIIGLEAAKRFAYTGEVWNGEMALAKGLISELHEEAALEAAVMAFAQQLAAGPTVAIGHAKRLFHVSLDNDLGTQLALESVAGKACARTADHREGLRAATERRAPEFQGK